MTQVATRDQERQTQVRSFRKDVNTLMEAGELALPSNIEFAAFRNALMVAVSDNPQILTCNKSSVFKSVRTLAAVGLMPDGREAAIVPFKGEAQAMPMVAGIIKVARNSGEVKSLWADVVYEGEIMNVWIDGGERKWSHTQADGSPIDAMSRGGDIRGAYAVATLKDGTVDFQPMSLEQLEKRRKASSNQKGDKPSGIWEKWYDEMAKKTVIRNLAKRLPMSAEDRNRIMIEEEINSMRDVTPEKGPSLAKQLMETSQKVEEEGDGEALVGQSSSPSEDTPEDPPVSGGDARGEGDAATHEDAPSPDTSAFEYAEGVQAAKDGKHTNPYEPETAEHNDWQAGHDGGGE